ncbi:unnamed protein product, partial [Prorocentrum cordatum]
MPRARHGGRRPRRRGRRRPGAARAAAARAAAAAAARGGGPGGAVPRRHRLRGQRGGRGPRARRLGHRVPVQPGAAGRPRRRVRVPLVPEAPAAPGRRAGGRVLLGRRRLRGPERRARRRDAAAPAPPVGRRLRARGGRGLHPALREQPEVFLRRLRAGREPLAARPGG